MNPEARKLTHRLAILAVGITLLVVVALSGTATAQAAGTIEGEVTNAAGEDIEGADIFDQRAYGWDGVPGPNAIHKAKYAPGDEIAFRITGGACPITQGDEITVRVVHTQTRSVIIEETLTAT